MTRYLPNIQATAIACVGFCLTILLVTREPFLAALAAICFGFGYLVSLASHEDKLAEQLLVAIDNRDEEQIERLLADSDWDNPRAQALLARLGNQNDQGF